MQGKDYAAIRTVLIVTLALNFLATAVKLTVGIWTGALSLIADGLDTLFDGITNVIGIIAVQISSQPPDAEHPYGHRKYETMAALFVAAALFLTAWEVGKGAVGRLLSADSPVVNARSVAALLLAASIQAGAGLWELRRARALDSELLLADARHTLSSVGVSAAVLVGLLLVRAGFAWADAAVALLVAGVIAKIGVDTVRENIPALVDRAPLDAEQLGAVIASVKGVAGFHRVRSRGPADNVAVDLHIQVDSSLSVQDANAIADEVRRRLLELPGVADVTVHAEALRGADSAADIYTAVKLIAQELSVMVHECWVQEDNGQLSVHLHVGVDPNLTLAAAHAVVDQLEEMVRQRQPLVMSVHTHIELATAEILPSARVSRALNEHIATAINDAAAGIHALNSPHDVLVRQVEGRLFITLAASVDGRLSVTEAHELSTQLQDAVRARIPNAGEVLIHLEPRQVEHAH